MADRSGAASQVGGALRIARGNHRPPVNEYLRPDLLGDDWPIQRDRAAARGRDAVLKAQVSSMFGRIAQPSPPQDRLALDQVVQPGLANLLGGEREGVAVVRQRAQEGEGAGDVVVGDDEGDSALLMDVAVDLSQLLDNHFVAPAFEGTAQVHADDLA